MADLSKVRSLKSIEMLMKLIEKLERDPTVLSDEEIIFVREALDHLGVKRSLDRLLLSLNKAEHQIQIRPGALKHYPSLDPRRAPD